MKDSLGGAPLTTTTDSVPSQGLPAIENKFNSLGAESMNNNGSSAIGAGAP